MKISSIGIETQLELATVPICISQPLQHLKYGAICPWSKFSTEIIIWIFLKMKLLQNEVLFNIMMKTII